MGKRSGVVFSSFANSNIPGEGGGDIAITRYHALVDEWFRRGYAVPIETCDAKVPIRTGISCASIETRGTSLPMTVSVCLFKHAVLVGLLRHLVSLCFLRHAVSAGLFR